MNALIQPNIYINYPKALIVMFSLKILNEITMFFFKDRHNNMILVVSKL